MVPGSSNVSDPKAMRTGVASARRNVAVCFSTVFETLPHPRARDRAFVLAPWSWLDPEAMLLGTPVAELARAAADAGTVRRVEAP